MAQETVEAPRVERITFQSILRNYAKGIGDGYFDTHVTDKKTRFYMERLLNVTSNWGHAQNVLYRDMDADYRARLVEKLNAFVWEARALISDRDIDAFDAAHPRVVEIIRNV